MTSNFSVPDAHQVQLCRESGVNPEGMTVIMEDDSVLSLKHHISGNEVLIIKGFAQRRKELNGNQ